VLNIYIIRGRLFFVSSLNLRATVRKVTVDARKSMITMIVTFLCLDNAANNNIRQKSIYKSWGDMW